MTEINNDTKDFKTMTLLNGTGDITVAWEEKDAEKIKKMIEHKMAQGCVFFILEKRPAFLSAFGKKKVYIKDIKQLRNKNSVTFKTKNCAEDIIDKRFNLGDPQVKELFKEGSVAIGRVPASDYDTTGIAQSPDEVLNNHTVATNKLVGG